MVANAPTLLAQIDTQLQEIQAKLRDGTGTGSDGGALIATLVANIATTKVVVDATKDKIAAVASDFQGNASIAADLVIIADNIP